ncbi:MAG: SUF system NifU family Fe-S cluster assembly protein, partial [Bacteroidota bacterium]
REFPARVKCASLAWHTMINALAEKGKDFISTE